MKTLLLGAVAYDPKVVPIWDIIRDYANAFGCKLDYVLFSNYERQVQWLKEGKIDIAWNTNVAYVRSLHITNGGVEAILMRDTDIGFKSVFVAKRDTIKSLDDLKGKRFGFGSLDSAQAAIMPLFYLQKQGFKTQEISLSDSVNKENIGILRFNSDVGKHGDTGRSEFDVLDRIKSGELDAGAIGSTTWVRVMQEGNYPQIVNFYTSPGYCHCNFTILKGFDSTLKKSFIEMMQSQNATYDEPRGA